MLAAQVDGAEVLTIEGLGQEGNLHPLQAAFREHHGLQCGYCTPGMIMAAADLLERNPDPSEEEVRHGLEGNLCRCTGYHNIVKAVQAAGAEAGGRMTPSNGYVGQSVKRREDRRMITGRGNYIDDMALPGMLHAAIVRSPEAHATITVDRQVRGRGRARGHRRLHRRGPGGRLRRPDPDGVGPARASRSTRPSTGR